MKIKSVSGFACFVKDLSKTVKFYEVLGFQSKKTSPASYPAPNKGGNVTLYSNWFWIDFISESDKDRSEYKKVNKLTTKGGGSFIYFSVDNVDDFYKMLLSKKIKPLTKPQDQPWGNREFILRDPDGYNLVIFKRK